MFTILTLSRSVQFLYAVFSIKSHSNIYLGDVAEWPMAPDY